MAEQSNANHSRLDPPFHFFVLPVLLISWVISVHVCVRNPSWLTGWVIVFVTAVIVLAFKSRLYALKVQDRVIRLEEKLRLAQLLPESQQAEIARLSEDQLIGLRFASDEELPALAQRAIAQNLSRKDIKQAIQHWRPDHWRV